MRHALLRPNPPVLRVGHHVSPCLSHVACEFVHGLADDALAEDLESHADQLASATVAEGDALADQGAVVRLELDEGVRAVGADVHGIAADAVQTRWETDVCDSEVDDLDVFDPEAVECAD